MRTLLTGSLALAGIVAASGAHATTGDLRLLVPLDSINRNLLKERAAQPVPSESRVLLSASGWRPASLSFAGNGEDLSRFSTRVPLVAAAFTTPVARLGRIAALDARIGVGAMSLERSAWIGETANRTRASQTLLLLPASVGVELHPTKLSWKSGGVYLGAGAMPTLALLGSSALSEARSRVGLPLEAALGAISRLGPVEIDMGISLVSSGSQELDLNGSGARVGVRLPL